MSIHQGVLCLEPIQLRPKFKADHKWFINQNRVSESEFILVPCGRCIVCKYRLCREWSNRIQMEMEFYGGVERCAFVTLTFDDEYLPQEGVQIKDVQDYLKRVRERLGGREIKYYAIGDYGELRGRPHYHLIIMNVDGFDYYGNLQRLKRKEPIIKSKDDWYHLHEAWQGKGYTDIQRPRSTGGVGGYVANYLAKMQKAIKQAESQGLNPPFRLMSKGLGLRSTIQLAKKMADNPDVVWPINYLERKGTDGKTYKFALGRYLRKKLHEFAGKLKIYEAQRQLNKYNLALKYGIAGVNIGETVHRESKEDQEKVFIAKQRALRKLGEC